MDGFSPRGGNNKQLNVLGGILEPCKSISQSDKDIITGFYRDNCCNTGRDDFGLHTVCCKMTNEFLDFSIMGIGTNSLGYGHDDIDNAVKEAISKGNMSTFNCPEEVYLAEKLLEINPWADNVKFSRTGGLSLIHI